MPLVEVTHTAAVTDAQLQRLAVVLPHAVSVAVECPEEPYVPPLRPGDVEIRFRPTGPHDVIGVDVVIEVRSKWFASRVGNRQQRVDGLLAEIERQTGLADVGVYLSLPVAAWAQTD